MTAWVGPLAAVLLLGTVPFEDKQVRFEVPEGWTVSGESGEYLLEAEPDVASLLLLPPDPDRPLETVLAEIEEQFVSTGQIEPEGSEERSVDGNVVHVNRYRFDMVGEAAPPVRMIQYSFVRSAVQVLLQVETSSDATDPEPLFAAVHGSLEILVAPDLFGAEDPGFDPDAEAIPEDDSAEIPEEPAEASGPPSP